MLFPSVLLILLRVPPIYISVFSLIALFHLKAEHLHEILFKGPLERWILCIVRGKYVCYRVFFVTDAPLKS